MPIAIPTVKLMLAFVIAFHDINRFIGTSLFECFFNVIFYLLLIFFLSQTIYFMIAEM